MTPMLGDATRQRILDLVGNEPGIHKSEVCRRLDLGWGTVSHHLGVLSRNQKLQILPDGRESRLFAPELPASEMRWVVSLREDIGQRVVAQLQELPGSRLKDLAVGLGASRKVVRRHLTRLHEGGIVTTEGGRQPRYSLRRGVWRRLQDLGLVEKA